MPTKDEYRVIHHTLDYGGGKIEYEVTLTNVDPVSHAATGWVTKGDGTRLAVKRTAYASITGESDAQAWAAIHARTAASM